MLPWIHCHQIPLSLRYDVNHEILENLTYLEAPRGDTTNGCMEMSWK